MFLGLGYAPRNQDYRANDNESLVIHDFIALLYIKSYPKNGKNHDDTQMNYAVVEIDVENVKNDTKDSNRKYYNCFCSSRISRVV